MQKTRKTISRRVIGHIQPKMQTKNRVSYGIIMICEDCYADEEGERIIS